MVVVLGVTIIPAVQKQTTGKVKPLDFSDHGAERRKKTLSVQSDSLEFVRLSFKVQPHVSP